ncbi:hypothetical protein [Xylophilus ampelinus]|uniref:Uncharacterized protein n=1 Tax=Xylophilus ampelinus TaxID=54067 RepID=A0A318SUI7_9BURK|nr:hypothetical protein [Xylophilus ampelinus]MCS4510061.1 hypothetical protein [Xylophilus ampelinus]PYE78357.1 hypothetical protein DFQ15_1077 [Xylophilus ampelinus]
MKFSVIVCAFSRGNAFLKRLSIAAGLGLSLVASASAQIDIEHSQQNTQPADSRPANIPAEYVVTPFGYFSPSCIREIHEGEKILDNEEILRIDGTIEPPNVCAQDNFTRQGERVSPQGLDEQGRLVRASTLKAVPPPTISYSYIEDGEYQTDKPVGRISASWTVPENPTLRSKQTIYFFPGVQGDTIMQPVLGYRGESDSWDLSSWNCCKNGTVNHSDFIPAKSGDKIVGDIYSTCAPGLACNRWNIDTHNLTTGKSVRLTSSPHGNPNLIMGGALEVYEVSACAEYPATGSLVFHDIEVYDQNSVRVASPPWEADSDAPAASPQCNYSTKVTPTSITITY